MLEDEAGPAEAFVVDEGGQAEGFVDEGGPVERSIDEGGQAEGAVVDEGSRSAIDEALVENEALVCPICLNYLVEPLVTPCGHCFCRACLLSATILAPDGRACPICRAAINFADPTKEPCDAAIERDVRALVGAAAYAEKQRAAGDVIRSVVETARSVLPIFFMRPGTREGAPVQLHLFEPRYKILIRRAWEGNRLFAFAAATPRHGDVAHIVRVDQVCAPEDPRRAARRF